MRTAALRCIVLLGVPLIGCASWKYYDTWNEYQFADKVHEYRQKYGEISVSQPVVVKSQKAFRFELGMKPDDFYKQVGTQARARFGEFETTGFRGAVKLEAPVIPEHTVQPVAPKVITAALGALLGGASEDGADAATPEDKKLLAEVLKAALGAYEGTLTDRTIPEQKPISVTAPENLSAQANAQTAAASKIVEGLAGGPELGYRPRDRVTEAANTFFHARLLETFSDPGNLRTPDGMEPLVIAGGITVTPGSITRKGFFTEIIMRAVILLDGKEVELLTADKTPVRPQFLSVFPTMVGQNMDLETIQSVRHDLALQLLASGYVAAADAVYDKSRIYQAAARSLNQRVSISSFTRPSYGQIGFRIRGEYWAAEPEKVDAHHGVGFEPSTLLEPVSLPFVVLMYAPGAPSIPKKSSGGTQSIASVLAQREALTQDIENSMAADPTNTRAIQEFQARLDELPRIDVRLDISQRWIPEDAGDATKYSDISLRESEYRAQAADHWKEKLLGHRYANPNGTHELDWNRGQWMTLPGAILDATSFRIPLSSDPAPRISSAIPGILTKGGNSSLVIDGQNFGDSPLCLLGGVRGTDVKLADYIGTNNERRQVLIASFDLSKESFDDQKRDVVVITPGGEARLAQHVKLAKPAAPTKAKPRTTIVVEQGGDTSKVTIEDEDGGAKDAAFKSIPAK